MRNLSVYSEKYYENQLKEKKKKLQKIFWWMTLSGGALGFFYGATSGSSLSYSCGMGLAMGAMFTLIPYSEIFADEDILPFELYNFFRDRSERIKEATQVGAYRTGAYAIQYFEPSEYFEITTDKAFYLVQTEGEKIDIVKQEELN